MAVAADLHRIPLSPDVPSGGTSDNGVSPDGLRLFYCRDQCNTENGKLQEKSDLAVTFSWNDWESRPTLVLDGLQCRFERACRRCNRIVDIDAIKKSFVSTAT